MQDISTMLLGPFLNKLGSKVIISANYSVARNNMDKQFMTCVGYVPVSHQTWYVQY